MPTAKPKGMEVNEDSITPLDKVKGLIRESVMQIDELATEKDKDEAFDFMAGVIALEGYVVLNSDTLTWEGPREYNIAMLTNDTGVSKNPRLDDLQNNIRQTKQGVDNTVSLHTAQEVAEHLVLRMALPNSPQKEDLIMYIRNALNFHVKDPAKWLNPLKD